MRRSGALSCAVCLIVATSLWRPSVAMAEADASLDRLPGKANALMTIDVTKVLGSQLAGRLDWQGKLIKGYADRPIAVSPAAKRVSIVAAMHVGEMKPIWQAAVVELPAAPNFDAILRTQGGYIDQINHVPAVWTPRDVYYVQIGANALGIVQPAARQYVSRWVSSQGPGAGISPYLKGAQAATADADVLFAVDLDDVVGPMAITYAYDTGKLPSLEKAADRDKLTLALASVRGMRLAAKITDQINGELTIDFTDGVAGLGDAAKPFVVDVLKAAELNTPMIDQWEFKADGNAISGKGPMRPESLSELMALLSPADVASGATAAAAAAAKDGGGTGTSGEAQPAAAGDPKAEPAAASQRYYRAVAGILDQMTTKASPTDSGRWLIAKARVIEQLPILNVDPALVAWGNQVSETLNRVAAELGTGQQRARNASTGVMSVSQTGELVGNATDMRNTQRQREQAAQNERTAAAARGMDMINQLLPTRGKIRAEMVQKYQVEF